MENSLSRQILLSILGLAILIVALVGVSYAVFTTGSSSSEINVINTGTISLSFSDSTNGIFISNAMPISDEEGKLMIGDNNVFDFVVNSFIAENATVSYEIVLEKVYDGKVLLNDNNVRLYLEKLVDGEYVSTPITEEPKSFIPNGVVSEMGSSPESMTLYYGNFQNNSEQKKTFTDSYRLRMWVAQDTVIDDISRSFQVRIKVYGKVL